MSAAKFTPGPWLVSPPSDSSDYEVFAPETNYVVAGEWGISELYDAHLIAAAPDLYDAADMALNALIGCCVPAGGVDDRKTMLEAQAMLRAAIAKATGATE